MEDENWLPAKYTLPRKHNEIFGVSDNVDIIVSNDRIQLAIEAGVTFSFSHEFYNEPYYGDDESQNWIDTQLQQGNEFAWFLAEIKVSFGKRFSHTENLGGCSYESLDDFASSYFGQSEGGGVVRKSCGYFGDMLESALDGLQEEINNFLDSDFSVLQGIVCL